MIAFSVFYTGYLLCSIMLIIELHFSDSIFSILHKRIVITTVAIILKLTHFFSAQFSCLRTLAFAVVVFVFAKASGVPGGKLDGEIGCFFKFIPKCSF